MPGRYPEPAQNPPIEPTADVFKTAAVSAVENAFTNQASDRSVGGHGLDSPKALTDAIGLQLRETLDVRYPERSEHMTVNANTIKTKDGSDSYLIRARSGDGTGIDINVTADSRVRMTPVQSLPGNDHKWEPTSIYRMEAEPGGGRGVLETGLETPTGLTWLPASSTAMMGAPSGVSGTVNNAFDGASGAFFSVPQSHGIARLLDRDPATGVRATRSGNDVTLPNSYQQDGQILYNGITVVSQAIRGRSESVLYDKGDLLARAHDAKALDQAFEQGGRQRVLLSRGVCDSQALDRGGRLDRGRG